MNLVNRRAGRSGTAKTRQLVTIGNFLARFILNLIKGSLRLKPLQGA